MTDWSAISPEAWIAATTTVSRYALAIDERDWESYRGLFANQVHADIQSFNGRPPAVVGLDDWVAGARARIAALDATQHSVTGPVVDQDPDGSMGVTAHVRAMHTFDGAWCELGGIYRHRVKQGEHGYVLSHIRLDVLWRIGDEDLFHRAYERAGIA